MDDTDDFMDIILELKEQEDYEKKPPISACKHVEVKCEKSNNIVCIKCGKILHVVMQETYMNTAYLKQKGITSRYSHSNNKTYPLSNLGTSFKGFCTPLKRMHQWTSNTSEKTLRNKRQKIIQVCNHYDKNISPKIVNSACDLYTEIFLQNDGVKRGMPLIGRLAACVLYAAEELDYPLQENAVLEMFFVPDTKKDKKDEIINANRHHLRNGMTYIADLKFYKNLHSKHKNKLSTKESRIKTVKNLINEHGIILNIDPVRRYIAQEIAIKIHQTKRDKDKQNKTFVSTCLVLMNERYPTKGISKTIITKQCGSTSGAINSFQKSILNYFIKKFNQSKMFKNNYHPKDEIFNRLYPSKSDIQLVCEKNHVTNFI